MSIFKRQGQGDVQATGAESSAETSAQGVQLEQPAKPMPPFVPPGAASRAAAAPGVVPPPAAPIYFEMRPPDAATRATDTGTLMVEQVKTPQEPAQEVVQQRVRVAMQRSRTSARAQQGARTISHMHTHHHHFDAVRAAQAGLLNLAWSWQRAGAPIRAIHAYMQVLHRYPDTPAADAAVADLVELSDKLAGEGQFHLALGIYEDLEELL